MGLFLRHTKYLIAIKVIAKPNRNLDIGGGEKVRLVVGKAGLGKNCGLQMYS